MTTKKPAASKEQEYIVISPVRVRGVLYREGGTVTCEAADLIGCEHCVIDPNLKVEIEESGASGEQ